jgi:hypothetical protein
MDIIEYLADNDDGHYICALYSKLRNQHGS